VSWVLLVTEKFEFKTSQSSKFELIRFMHSVAMSIFQLFKFPVFLVLLSIFRVEKRGIGALFLCFILFKAGVVEASPKLGLWVEVEGENQPFSSKDNFEKYQQFIADGRFTDLYCQVYRGGRSWFPSMLADDSPYREAIAEGFDPLAETIKAAHSRGQRVHAWVNVLRAAHNREAPILKVVGKRAVLVDSRGHSLLDYSKAGDAPVDSIGRYRVETPALWLDPGVAPVRDYVLQTILDLLQKYPQLDGIHLDMIRYPFAVPVTNTTSGSFPVSYGYSKESIANYYASYGTPNTDVAVIPSGSSWDEWRRLQVTQMVFEIKELVNKVKPGLEISAAVIADQDRAVNKAFQNWPSWRQGNLLATAIPMNYTADNILFKRLVQNAAEGTGSANLLIGIGAWLLLDRGGQLQDQMRIANAAKTDGVVLFSYSNLFSKRGRELVARANALTSEFKTTNLSEQKVLLPVALEHAQ